MIKKITLLTMLLLLTLHFTAFAATQVVLVLSTAGTTGKMAGVQVTVTLPAVVAVQADPVTGEIRSPTLTASGGWAGEYVVARFTPATATVPGTVWIAMMNAAGADPGEFARLTCDVTDGSATYPSSFPLSGVVISDLYGLKVSGATVSLAFNGPTPVDTDPPALTISTPADGAVTNNSTLNVSGSVTDAGGVRSLTINSVPVTPDFSGHFSHPLQLAGGANTITTIATDNANNQTSDVRTITSDTGVPSLAVTNPAQDITTDQSSITISGTVADALTAVTTVTVSCDGLNYTPPVTSGAFSQTINFSADKTYAVTVTATDQAGNQAQVVRNVIYQKPAVTRPGDCDGDGSVTIAEVQSAINMFLGLKPVAGCVDVDGNRSVSIAEVQKTINSFLGL